MATRQSSRSPGVYTRRLPNWSWKLETPKRVPAGARISAGKLGRVEISLPAHAASVVNCSPVTCMPSPESPAKRMTARVSVRRGFATAGAGVTVSLMVSIVLSVTSSPAQSGPDTCHWKTLPGRSRYELMLPKTASNGKDMSALPRSDQGALPGCGLDALLQLQEVHFRGAGEIAAAPDIHHDHVLDPHRAAAGVVETGLDGHHLSRLQLVVEPADPRRLVDVEPDAVAGAVEKALLPAVHHARDMAARLHGPGDLGVDGPARRAIADQLDPAELSGEDGVVEPPQLVGGLALDHRPRHVRVIASLGGAGKYVEDDPLVGVDGTRALVVGIHPLLTAGDDGVLGDAVVFHERDVHDLLEVFGGQRAAPVDHLVAADRARPEHVEGRLEGRLGVPLRLLDGGDLLDRLDHPLGKERVRPRGHPQAALAEAIGQLEREVRGHLDRRDAITLEQQGHRVREARLGPALAGLALPLGGRQDLVHPRLGTRAIHLDIGHQEDPLAVDLEIHEGIRGQEPAGVIEVRDGLAGRDDQ